MTFVASSHFRQDALPAPLLIQVDSTVTTCSVAVVAPLPSLDRRELNALEIAMWLLKKEGSVAFSPGTIRQIVVGGRIQTGVQADCCTISFQIPLGTESQGESLMLSLLKDPSFDQDQIAGAVQEFENRSMGYWLREVDPQPVAVAPVSSQELLDVYRKVFNSANLRAGMISTKAKPELASRWADAFGDWPPPPQPQITEDPPPFVYPTHQPSVSTVEILGHEAPATAETLPANLLALYALGAGKTCSLFRIVRLTHGWSYDQESLLRPTEKGWQPALFIAMAPNPDNRNRIAQARKEILEDIASWTNDQLVDAQGMAEANLTRNVPFGPLLWLDEPFINSPDQRLGFELYWKIKTGTSWSRREILSGMDQVTLDMLKKSAAAILAGSTLHYLPAES